MDIHNQVGDAPTVARPSANLVMNIHDVRVIVFREEE